MQKEIFEQYFNLREKTIVITGGGGVLGGELAVSLGACGAHIAILDHSPNLPTPLQSRMELADISYEYHATDVLNQEALVTAFEAIVARRGSAPILINAAGGNHPQATTNGDLSFFDLPQEALRFTFDLNLMGTILPSQVFGRGMAAQKEGIILNISSMNGFRPLTRIPAYAAAKAGVNNFTQWLAVYMAQTFSPLIRVNAIAPGFFLTEQNRYLLTDIESGALTERGETIIAHTPMGRFGQPSDLIGTVMWLLSPASSFVTGVVVPIDGGFSAFSGV